MELHEAIAAVHEAMEGRYNLTGQDLYNIHHFLCEHQQFEKHARPGWLTDKVCTEAKIIGGDKDDQPFARQRAIMYLIREASGSCFLDYDSAVFLFELYCK